MKIAYLFVLAHFLMFSCADRSAQSGLAADAERKVPKPLIIGMSGFATCRTSDQHDGEWGPLGHAMFARVLDLRDQIRTTSGYEPDVMASCFTADKELITSSSPGNWELHYPEDDEYIEHLHHKMSEYTDVFVIGHSYGGWLAMKLVESWQGAPELIKTLHTIDPISKRLCFFDKPSDCLSAPKDITVAGRKHIRENSGAWINPWQQKTFFLHSSIIPQADANPLFDLNHWDLDTHDEIWDDVKSRATL